MGISSSDNLEKDQPRDDELMIWLKGISPGYSVYHHLFQYHGYDDLTTISLMNASEKDLIQLGIQKKGHIKRLRFEIQKLRKKGETGR